MIKKLLKIIYLKLPKRQKEKAIYYYKWRPYFHKNFIAALIRLFMKNKKIRNINLFEQRFYSQNGEDGIIKIIFDKIGTTNKFCVEFGVGNGTECNTQYLIKKQGWNFLHMDCGDKLSPSTKKETVTAENINSLFKKYKVSKEFDLLSIDINFNDYWVWKAIDGYSPRVVVIEYNSSIPPTESKTVKYDPNAQWDGTNYFGASLFALAKLGKSKGYTLIGCDRMGSNAFFVRNDLIKENFQIKSVEKIYKPPRYGKKVNGRCIGHPQSNKSMTPV
ncbi:MAG: hypothetical protein ABIJ80_01640 [Patescibacteria group bacterium]|nr:hypothetical protein [Patescibacteria group bacterium]MBU2416606.1 hypothetical protein [Patescibacteria group bacterium]MBU2461164.1 hypothetical protein [Patescibacteria group bacterium]